MLTATYARLQAWLMATLGAHHSRLVSERKHALLSGLRGRVVEIGPGGGVNFEFFTAADVEWIGVEPNPFAHGRLQDAAAVHGVHAKLLDGTAASIDLPDGSVDAVVSTLVLCSVPDQRAALTEIHRILRPGGRFVFVEHVAARPGTLLRRIQRAVRGPWRVAGGGCEPDRDTAYAIEHAGFRHVDLTHFGVALPIVAPHISGTAHR